MARLKEIEYLRKIKTEFGNAIEIDKRTNKHLIDNEKEYGNGCWVYLKDKYISKDTQCHIVHEDSFMQCYKSLKYGGIAKKPKNWR